MKWSQMLLLTSRGMAAAASASLLTLKSDKEVVLAAVNRNGFNLQLAAVILKSDKEVVLAAVN